MAKSKKGKKKNARFANDPAHKKTVPPPNFKQSKKQSAFTEDVGNTDRLHPVWKFGTFDADGPWGRQALDGKSK